MFDAAFSDICGPPSAIFSVSAFDINDRRSMIRDVALLHACDIMHTVRYGIIPTYVDIFHSTVHCTMRVEGRRHSWRILRGNGGMGAVCDAAFSDISGLPRANFFCFSAWGYTIQMSTRSSKASPGHWTEGEKSKVFSSTFRDEALLLDGFLCGPAHPVGHLASRGI